jgi:alanyl-tRNA synthetase
MQDHVKSLERELSRLKGKLTASQSDGLADQAVTVGNVKVLAAQIAGDAQALRETADKLKDRLKSCILILGSASDGKVILVAMVSSDLTNRVKAGELVNYVATQVGGKGGGRPDMAQAGGTDAGKLPAALASAIDWVANKLT